MTNLLIRARAWATGQKLVWLKHKDGSSQLTLANLDPWGDLVATVHCPFFDRPILLKPDGTVDDYTITKWIADGGAPFIVHNPIPQPKKQRTDQGL